MTLPILSLGYGPLHDKKILQDAMLEPENLPQLWSKGRQLVIPTNAGWTEVATGSGAGAMAIFQLYTATGATNSSTDMYRVNVSALGVAGTGYGIINWAKKHIFIFRVWRATTSATTIGRVQLKNAATIGAMGEKGIGIRVDNFAIVGESYGASLGTQATGITMVTGEDNKVVIIHDPDVPKIEWWVDGVLKATETTSAKIPQALTAVQGTFVVSIEKGAVADTPGFLIEFPLIWQSE